VKKLQSNSIKAFSLAPKGKIWNVTNMQTIKIGSSSDEALIRHTLYGSILFF
jgi:hypothetical protein